jgi:hypothetical protein
MIQATARESYTHYQGGHCESGAVSSLLRNYGFDLSEPMAFGITSNIGFVFFPFIKLWGNPLISFRMIPKSIVKRVQKRLGIRFCVKTYRDEQAAMDELDRLLAEGKPIGVQAAVAFLPYFMRGFRIPFNGHMIIVSAKEGDEYIVNDPLYDHSTRVTYEDLRKARFATGPMAPHGFIFYPLEFPESIDYKKIIQKAIKQAAFMMTQPMFPFYGILGIKTFARKIGKLQKETNRKAVRSFLSHLFIVQEEQGTGGGGFRYMYAAFLREAYDLFNIPDLLEGSKKMLEIGDMYRDAVLSCAKFIQKKTDEIDLVAISRMYRKCAEEEKKLYKMLGRIKWQ